jgi:hypothetical protein
MKKLMLTLASLVAAGTLSATGYLHDRIVVPFEFKVDKVALPAGEYRLERDFGSYIVTLVNLNSGRRVQVLRDSAPVVPGRAKLIFENGPQGHKLIRVS